MKKKEKLNYIVPILFLLYLALLIWIILFKLQFSILDLDRVREINLIPFYYEHEVTFHAAEVLQNVLIFMPFGIYMCLLFPKSRFGCEIAFDFRSKFAAGNLPVCLSDWPVRYYRPYYKYLWRSVRYYSV